MLGRTGPVLLAIVSLFSGCAGQGGASPKTDTAADLARQACMRSTGARELLAVEVPTSGNGLANQLSIAALQASPSTTAETLTRLLTARKGPVLVVYGENPGLNVATLQAALHSVPGSSAVMRLPVCIAGLDDRHTSLIATAQRAGIALIAVPQP